MPIRRNTIFSHLMQLICQYRFKKCVDRYRGDRYTKRFSCWQHLLVLLFAQAKGLTSLRNIEVSLRSHYQKWYHLGLSISHVARWPMRTPHVTPIFSRRCFIRLWRSAVISLPSTVSGSRINCICSDLCLPVALSMGDVPYKERRFQTP